MITYTKYIGLSNGALSTTFTIGRKMKLQGILLALTGDCGGVVGEALIACALKDFTAQNLAAVPWSEDNILGIARLSGVFTVDGMSSAQVIQFIPIEMEVFPAQVVTCKIYQTNFNNVKGSIIFYFSP
jgi:hypothetical protein